MIIRKLNWRVLLQVFDRILALVIALILIVSCAQVADSPNKNGPSVDELTEDFLDALYGNADGPRATNIVFPTLARWEVPVRVAVLGHATSTDQKWIEDAMKIYADAANIDIRFARAGEIANLVIAIVASVSAKDVISEIRDDGLSALAHGVDFTNYAKVAFANEAELSPNLSGDFANYRKFVRDGLMDRYSFSVANRMDKNQIYCHMFRIMNDNNDESKNNDTIVITISQAYWVMKKCINFSFLRAFGYYNFSNTYKNYTQRKYHTLTDPRQYPEINQPTYYDLLFTKSIYQSGVETGMIKNTTRPIIREFIDKQLREYKISNH